MFGLAVCSASLVASTPAHAAPSSVTTVVAAPVTNTVTLGEDVAAAASPISNCEEHLTTGKRVLVRGSTGPCVKLLQTWLTALNTAKAGGFDQPKLAVDGIYGPKTKAQVREFQRVVYPKAGPVDGIVGPRTAKAMLELANG